MNTLTDRPAPLLIVDLMHEALRVRDEELNAIAIELFARAGGELVRRLVLEACCRKNPLGYRLRVLEAIARVGTIPDSATWLDLLGLLGDRHDRIRAAATSLLHRLNSEIESAQVARR